jgi:hypothetical protein
MSKESILLGDEQICEACPAVGMRTTEHKQLRCSPAKCLVHPDFKNTAEAAAIHVVRHMEEECKEHQIARYKDKWQLRLNCPDCMAEIKKELNIP